MISTSQTVASRRDAFQSHLSYLLARLESDPDAQACSTCSFEEEMHDDDNHQYTGWPLAIIINKIQLGIGE